jgi:prepilin-type N-terminal cleavage/methylation domain-containing protein
MVSGLKWSRARKSDDGFTLIELIVVIIIIGLLAAIAIPNFLVQRKRSYDTQARSDLRSMGTAQNTYAADQAGFVTCAGAIACSSSTLLGAYGFAPTSGVKIASVADGANGFCAVALSQSGKYFVYDSESGGLAAYNSTVVPTATNDGLPTGACVNVSTYPTPAA